MATSNVVNGLLGVLLLLLLQTGAGATVAACIGAAGGAPAALAGAVAGAEGLGP